MIVKVLIITSHKSYLHQILFLYTMTLIQKLPVDYERADMLILCMKKLCDEHGIQKFSEKLCKEFLEENGLACGYQTWRNLKPIVIERDDSERISHDLEQKAFICKK